MKNFITITLLSLLLISCSSFNGQRHISSTGSLESNSCKWSVNSIILNSLSPLERAKKLYALRSSKGLPLHLDLGGEGRYSDAINVNPGPYTSTTGNWGEPIPFWVKGRSDEIPFPNNSIDKITVENAPLTIKSLEEILRVLRPRGNIHLSHPEDYASSVHQMVIDAFPNAEVRSEVIGTNLVTKIKFSE